MPCFDYHHDTFFPIRIAVERTNERTRKVLSSKESLASRKNDGSFLSFIALLGVDHKERKKGKKKQTDCENTIGRMKKPKVEKENCITVCVPAQW